MSNITKRCTINGVQLPEEQLDAAPVGATCVVEIFYRRRLLSRRSWVVQSWEGEEVERAKIEVANAKN